MKPDICQSCGLPFSSNYRGTNRNRTENIDYCGGCFKNGEFTNHSLSLHSLEVKIMEMAKVHEEITLEEAQNVIKILPHLKRWKFSLI